MELLHASWKWLLVRGALGILFGILAIAAPISTIFALAIVWGIWAITDAVGLFADAFTVGGFGSRLFSVGLGVIALLAGLYAIFQPGKTAIVLTWVLGIWLVVRGIFEAVATFGPGLPGAVRAMTGIGAALSVVLGVLLMSNPGSGALSVTTVLGFFAIAWGVVLVGLGWSVRGVAREVDAEGPHHDVTT